MVDIMEWNFLFVDNGVYIRDFWYLDYEYCKGTLTIKPHYALWTRLHFLQLHLMHNGAFCRQYRGVYYY